MFKKNLHLCFFKIQCLPTSFSPPLTLEDEEENHHDVTQITIHNNHHQPFIMKNFNSVYDLSQSSSTTTTTATTTSDFFSSSSSISTTADSHTETRPPDFSGVFSSDRFFVSSPGRSNSILESSSASSSSSSSFDAGEKPLVHGGVPVKKYSPDPYADFRRSMEEMIEARDNNNGDGRSDWEYLHELLLSYLTLNPKHMHKFIIGAFSDLLVSMMSTDAQSHIRCSTEQPV